MRSSNGATIVPRANSISFSRREPVRSTGRQISIAAPGPLLVKCKLTDDDVPRYNFHLLRHAAASLFIAYLKWPPKRIQTVMGHAKIALTFDLYGHQLSKYAFRARL